MARVLFVVHDGVSHEPLGLEYLSGSLLRAGHETKACVQSKALETCNSWGPDFAAFQVLTGDENRWGKVANEIKDKYPQIKTIAGGPHFLFYDDLGGHESDAVLRGESEYSICEAVEGRTWDNFKAPSDLDLLAFPDRGLFYNDDFPGIKNNVIRNSMGCRGCPYKCTYCYNSNPKWLQMVSGQRIRYHSSEWLCDSIGRIISDYGGTLVSFQDDIFGIDTGWLEKFAVRYRQSGLPPFFAQLRPHLITEERVRLLKEAGVHIISFAIESGNEETRAQVLDRKESNELILKGAGILHKHGIKFRTQNMLGLPVDEPLGDALETLRFNMQLRPSLSWCSLLQAYPGTEIANFVIRKGLVKSMEELQFKVNATFFDTGSLPIKNKEKIERLHKYWSAVVRWPALYPLVRVLINLDLGHKAHEYIFDRTKQYINQREYWRVEGKRFDAHISHQQTLDRLGGELRRVEQKPC